MPSTQLSHEQLHKLEKALLSQQQNLIKQLDGSAHQESEQEHDNEHHSVFRKNALSTGSTSATSELSSNDNHPADLGTELFEITRDATLHRQYLNQLAQTEQALERLRGHSNGSYGLCKHCSQPIPYERLEALPEADTCIAHSAHYSQPQSDLPLLENSTPYSEPAISVLLHQEGTTTHSDVDTWSIVHNWGNSDSPAMSASPALYDGDDYSEFDESTSYVEPIEEFLATDLYGNQPIIVRNKAYADFLANQENDPTADEGHLME